MNLVHIVSDGSPGGGTSFVLTLIRALQPNKSVKIHLICDKGSHLARQALQLDVVVHEMSFYRGRVNPAVPITLWRTLRSIRPDVVHAHGGRVGFFLGFVPRVAQESIVYTVHGYHFLHKRFDLRLLGALAEMWAGYRSDCTVFVSEHDRIVAEQWRLLSSTANRQVIRNAIDVERIPLAAHSDQRLLAFVGRLSYQKDPLLFLDIARILAPRGYRFLIIGGGELEAIVRRRVAHYQLEPFVTILIGLGQHEVFENLKHASALVMTSRWEGLPLTLLEAMAMGIPVVSAQVAGTTELIRQNVTGILIDGRDPQIFADEIRRVCEDYSLRERLQAAARERILTDFAYDNFIESYLALYGHGVTTSHDLASNMQISQTNGTSTRAVTRCVK